MGRLKDNTSVTISFILFPVPFILVLLGEETAKPFLKQIKEKITFFSCVPRGIIYFFLYRDLSHKVPIKIKEYNIELNILGK